jgi:hypothetical protein
MTEITDSEAQDAGYKKDYSFNYSQTNIFSLGLLILSFLVLGGIYILIWGGQNTWNDAKEYIFNALITIPIIIAGIFIHEGLHAIPLLIISKIPLKGLKAGVNWINFTPYIHCKHPVSVTDYRISSLFPAVLLGFIPAITGIIIGFFPFLFFGIIFIITAGSDLLSIWKLRKVPGNFLASDHPEKAGCVVYENPFA